jgi:hypothetical protein
LRDRKRKVQLIAALTGRSLRKSKWTLLWISPARRANG